MNGLVIALLKLPACQHQDSVDSTGHFVNFVNSLSSLRHLVRVRPEVTAARQLAAFTIGTEHSILGGGSGAHLDCQHNVILTLAVFLSVALLVLM